MNALSFFTDSKTVWVSENFQNIFLKSYDYSEKGRKDLALTFLDLEDIQDGENAQRLVFQDSDTFLEQLAVLIQRQIHGEEGRLLNDSSANYFFVEGKDGNLYSILVRWEPAQKLWRCGAYLQEDLKMPNIRIFRPE